MSAALSESRDRAGKSVNRAFARQQGPKSSDPRGGCWRKKAWTHLGMARPSRGDFVGLRRGMLRREFKTIGEVEMTPQENRSACLPKRRHPMPLPVGPPLGACPCLR